MTAAGDADLVQACRDGDPETFGILVERYQKAIFNAALGLVNDREDAKDIAQNAFLKAYDNLATYNPDYKFYSWLYRIAINESINLLSRKGRFQALDADREADQLDPEAVVVNKETSRHVRIALMGLTVDHRTVLVLRHFLGTSYEEIAQIVNVPEKTVKSRLFKARFQLREILAKMGIFK